jgi:DNA polymerase I-like protein with 3'-5' exonuclease and polymerase domains
VKHFIRGKLVACDTETTGLGVWHGDAPFAFSFWNEYDESYYIECFADKSVTKVFHNAKFDVRIMENAFGIKVRGRIEETMFAAHACNNIEPTFKLKSLAAKYQDIPHDDAASLQRWVIKLRNKAKKLGYTRADDPHGDYWMPRHFANLEEYEDDKDFQDHADLCEVYAVRDVERTMRLWEMYDYFMDELEVRDTYEREMALWPVTYAMETRGVLVDPEQIEIELENCHQEMKKSMRVLKQYAGRGFNPNSPKQLSKLLYTKLKLPILERTATNMPSTKATVLEKLNHPVVDALLRYRAYEKAASTFFGNFKNLRVEDEDDQWQIHTDFNQVGPKTGRFSCRQPNLQNVSNPKTSRSKHAIQARNVFIPRPGFKWYAFDYSQLEVRVFAHRSRDEAMLYTIEKGIKLHKYYAEAGWGGEDNMAGIDALVHSLELNEEEPSTKKVAKAWKILKWKPGKKDPKAYAEAWFERHNWSIVDAEDALGKEVVYTAAKTVVFAKLFGGGVNPVMAQTGMSESQARMFLRKFDTAFSGIKRHSNEMIREGQINGFIRNDYNRRLEVDPEKAYRATNHGVQSGAADLMKDGMLKVDMYLRRMRDKRGIEAYLVMTIHDELVVEIREGHDHMWLLRKIARLMEDHEGRFSIPMPVECDQIQGRWSEKKPVRNL